MDKRDFVHRPIFVQIRCLPHTKSLTSLYRMQVLVLVRFSALIHRNRTVLTTITKLVYLLVLVKKEQPTQAGRPSRRCRASMAMAMADSTVRTALFASVRCDRWQLADASNPGTKHAGGARTASSGQRCSAATLPGDDKQHQFESRSTRFAGARAKSRTRPVDKSMNIHRRHLWITAYLSTSLILSRFGAAPIQSC